MQVSRLIGEVVVTERSRVLLSDHVVADFNPGLSNQIQTTFFKFGREHRPPTIKLIKPVMYSGFNGTPFVKVEIFGTRAVTVYDARRKWWVRLTRVYQPGVQGRRATDAPITQRRRPVFPSHPIRPDNIRDKRMLRVRGQPHEPWRPARAHVSGLPTSALVRCTIHHDRVAYALSAQLSKTIPTSAVHTKISVSASRVPFSEGPVRGRILRTSLPAPFTVDRQPTSHL
ncbi:hypothetical protein EVAR_17754_1 [Eumeta japonica]|uniref:Uncharacterized protein n=1 Tax=Eumeta variegata TaxID=151549 RepID=A0A4C1TTB5_EUMVA|nr:hypothetical protein EVAR_17754_1 [Eumeta japonica]